MIRESDQHTDGRGHVDAVETASDEFDVTTLNVRAGKSIAELLRPTFGPTGRDKMLVDSNNMVVVTNDGATILGEMDVELDLIPAGKLMVDLGRSQNRHVGDATKTAVLLAGELLYRSGALLEKGLHPTVIGEGYKRAMRRAVTLLEEQARDVDVDDVDRLREVACIAMTGRGPVGANDALSDLVVEAIRTIETDSKIDLDNVTVVKATGGIVNDSMLIKGLILDTADPVFPSMPTKVTDARIVCFDSGLDPTKTTADLSVTDSESLGKVIDFERRTAEEIGETLVGLGINVVFCDDNIGERVQVALEKRGILAIKRMTPEDIGHVVRATGSTLISDVKGLGTADIGRADLVEFRNVSGDDLLVITGCENPKSVTLLLHGGTEHSIDEVERAVKNSLAVVRTTVLDGRVLPGGGASEVEAARVLRRYSRSIEGREQLAVDAFADALETIPRTLAENLGYNSIDSLVQLRREHDAGEIDAGLTIDRGVVTGVLDEGIVDSLPSKVQAITGAAEMVAQVLRVDALIAADDLGEGFIHDYA